MKLFRNSSTPKVVFGSLAFVAPIVLGVMLTAGASLGSSYSEGDTEDVWIIGNDDGSEYTLERIQTNGVVTLTVTDGSGAVIPADEFPADVAEAAAEFGSESWVPPEAIIGGEVIDEASDTPCYNADNLAKAMGDDSDYGVTATADDRSFALEVSPDGAIDAAYFEREVDQGELDDHRNSGGSYLDFEGAIELRAC